jgi:hypothetical protein
MLQVRLLLVIIVVYVVHNLQIACYQIEYRIQKAEEMKSEEDTDLDFRTVFESESEVSSDILNVDVGHNERIGI